MKKSWIVVIVLVLVMILAWLVRIRGRIVSGGGHGRSRGHSRTSNSAPTTFLAPISYKPQMIKECRAAIKDLTRRHPAYTPSTALLPELGAIATLMASKYDVPFGLPQIVAMYNMDTAELTMRCGIRAMRNAPELLDEYQSGASLVELADKYKLTPLTILRQFYDQREVPITLTEAEIAELHRIDGTSPQHMDKIRKDAQEYEDKLAAEMRNHGWKFKTENEIRAEHTTGPLITPDYLMDKDSAPIVDGAPIYWIDAKNYPYYGSDLVAKKLLKQSIKYNAAFGPGAFVFNGGIISATRRPPFDARALSMTLT